MSRILFRTTLEGYTTDNSFSRWMKREGIPHQRRVTINAFGVEGLQRAWIVSYDDFYKFIIFSGWVNRNALIYDITGCNKQYVSSLVVGQHSTYLGSMCEVNVREAQAHISAGGWSLMDTKNSLIWIVEKRNPDRVMAFTSHGIQAAASASPWPVDPQCPRHALEPGRFIDAEVA